MKSVFYSCLFLAGCLFFIGCGPSVDKSTLVGKWQGTSIDYPDESWTYKGGIQAASGIYYDFNDDGTYVGTDITGTPETGTYNTLADMLYLHPKGDDKRAYELESKTADELVFNINPGAISVRLTLKRK